MFHSIITNLTQPTVLFFIVGVILVVAKSGYEYPPQLYKSITLYLLFAIGLHGGEQIVKFDPGKMAALMTTGFVTNLAIGIVSFFILLYLVRLPGPDAAAVAGHYGSDSAAAFAAGLGFLTTTQIEYEPFMSALLAVMEIPGVLVAMVIARVVTKPQAGTADQGEGHGGFGTIIREALFSPSILMLITGTIIGMILGEERLIKTKPLFDDLFPGVLCLYMVEMGMTTAGRMKDVLKVGPKLVIFAALAPVVFGGLGVAIAVAFGLKMGSAVLFGILCGSSSFIAVPAAVRLAIPEANPSIYMTASLGVTFPFVVSLGIPLYLKIAQLLMGQ
jgi:uncharacterized protein